MTDTLSPDRRPPSAVAGALSPRQNGATPQALLAVAEDEGRPSHPTRRQLDASFGQQGPHLPRGRWTPFSHNFPLTWFPPPPHTRHHTTTIFASSSAVAPARGAVHLCRIHLLQDLLLARSCTTITTTHAPCPSTPLMTVHTLASRSPLSFIPLFRLPPPVLSLALPVASSRSSPCGFPALSSSPLGLPRHLPPRTRVVCTPRKCDRKSAAR